MFLWENLLFWKIQCSRIEAGAFLKGFNDCINCTLLHKHGPIAPASEDQLTGLLGREWWSLLVIGGWK